MNLLTKTVFIPIAALALGLTLGCNSYRNAAQPESGNITATDAQRPLSDFNIYRGNSHSHTIFTWTHGEHREKGINDLKEPTEFHPDYKVPPGTDWRDHKTINLDPTTYSNRQGLPENHFDLAIANGYDFYAITDHTQEPPLQPVSKDNWAWQATLKAADKYNGKSNFVAIAGFEYSRNSPANGGSGHINVLNVSEYVNADHGQRGPAEPWPAANWTIPQFYHWIKSAKPHNPKAHLVVGFNHPSVNQYDDWANIDEELKELISTFEIHTNYKQNRWKAYTRALNKGWKLSPIGVHDNHGFHQILRKDLPPPTLVLAPELTLEAITYAMRHRRTFVSFNEGVELRYSVNGHIMGSTLNKPDTYNFHIELKTPAAKPTESVRRIQLLSNDPKGGDDMVVVKEAHYDGSVSEITWNPVIKDKTAKYFILLIHHANDITDDGSFKPNGSTISAPVWTGR